MGPKIFGFGVLGQKTWKIIRILFFTRFDSGFQKMILELEALFGRERLWDNVIIEVTKWAYDIESIKERKRKGITEESALNDINQRFSF